MSSASLSIRSIRQAGLGQHVGSWSAPVNRVNAMRAGRFDTQPAVRPDYRQPQDESGAGTEHGGRTP
jgi:hypothetical protein